MKFMPTITGILKATNSRSGTRDTRRSAPSRDTMLRGMQSGVECHPSLENSPRRVAGQGSLTVYT